VALERNGVCFVSQLLKRCTALEQHFGAGKPRLLTAFVRHDSDDPGGDALASLAKAGVSVGAADDVAIILRFGAAR
jgi:hypothetical protein